MSLQENKELVRRYIDLVWNQHGLEGIDQFIGHELQNEVRDHVRQFQTSFSDIHVTIEGLIAEGDTVATRLLISGTHTGHFADHPPTGKRIEFRSIRFWRIADARIVEIWAMQDRLGLMEQLGLVQTVHGVNWASGHDRPAA